MYIHTAYSVVPGWLFALVDQASSFPAVWGCQRLAPCCAVEWKGPALAHAAARSGPQLPADPANRAGRLLVLHSVSHKGNERPFVICA